MKRVPTYTDVKQAARRIKPYITHTHIRTSSRINQMLGCEVFFKCENFQRVGAFKFRGACNAVLSLTDEEASRGVVTHSSGNHAQALSLAASIRKIPAYVVMPHNAPNVKKDAVKAYGAEITFCEPTQQDRENTASEIADKTGAVFIHPYDHPDIIAGHGTAVRELLYEVPDLDSVIVPVGGGGLLSGTALAVKSILETVQVIGVEPENADDAFQSFKEKKLIRPDKTNTAPTIADGLRTSLSELTFQMIIDYADDIITVDENSIIRDMKFIWERMNIIIEPSSAVPFSALFNNQIEVKGKKIGLIITGGNVDLNNLPWHDCTSSESNHS
jgi:threonine dehydratase